MALEGAAEAPPGALAPAGPSAASPATPAGWGSNGGSLLVSRERLVAPPDRTLALPHLALLQHLAGTQTLSLCACIGLQGAARRSPRLLVCRWLRRLTAAAHRPPLVPAGRAASAEGRAQLRLLQHLLLGFATQQQAQAGR